MDHEFGPGAVGHVNGWSYKDENERRKRVLRLSLHRREQGNADDQSKSQHSLIPSKPADRALTYRKGQKR